ncbi:MAG: RNA chaperone Hfq [Thermoanaerobaculia bacterium]
MAKHTINIQDGFLFSHLKEATDLTFELVNSKRLLGRIKRFDRFSVVVSTSSQDILVYKHAISTISAAGPGN